MLSGLEIFQQLQCLRMVTRPLDHSFLQAIPLLTNLVELSVDFITDADNPNPTLGDGEYANIELLQLVWLNVSGPARASPLMSCAYWHMPRLRHLVVHVTGGPDDYTCDGLSKLGGSLESLQLYGWFGLSEEVGLNDICPQLRYLGLDCTENCLLTWKHPNLEELVLHDAYWGFEHGISQFYVLIKHIARNRSDWPKLRKIVDLAWPGPAPFQEPIPVQSPSPFDYPFLVWWGPGTVTSLQLQGVDCVGYDGKCIPDITL
jgi:hypothetical protein